MALTLSPDFKLGGGGGGGGGAQAWKGNAPLYALPQAGPRVMSHRTWQYAICIILAVPFHHATRCSLLAQIYYILGSSINPHKGQGCGPALPKGLPMKVLYQSLVWLLKKYILKYFSKIFGAPMLTYPPVAKSSENASQGPPMPRASGHAGTAGILALPGPTPEPWPSHHLRCYMLSRCTSQIP